MTAGVSIPARRMWVYGTRQLKEHSCLWAVVGACALAGSFTTSALLYAANKEGVSWNRWRFTRPHEAVTWDRAGQKIMVLSKEAKSLYIDDPPLKNLLREIYADGRYDATMGRKQ